MDEEQSTAATISRGGLVVLPPSAPALTWATQLRRWAAAGTTRSTKPETAIVAGGSTITSARPPTRALCLLAEATLPTDRLIVVRQRVRKLLHSKSYARLQTKKGAHQPLIIVKKIPDQVTSAVHAWLAVRRPHATTPGDDGLFMASGGTRQVPTTAMTGGMSSDMLRHATSPAADGGYA